MTSPLRILLLEDDQADAALVQELLEAEHFVCETTCVQTPAEFQSALEKTDVDLILSDYMLPSFDGFSALKIALNARPDLPFIFVSGTLGEEIAIDALKIGATDYVLKTRMSRLVPAVERALRETRERAERKRAEAAARRSEKELRDVIETIPVMVWSALPDGSNAFVNGRWMEYTGLSAEQSAGSGWQATVHPDDVRQQRAKWRASVVTGAPYENEARYRGADGEYRWHLVRGLPLRDEQGRILRWYGTLTDIEDRKRAEEALKRSEAYLAEAQRLTLTGSWAWDAETGKMLYCSSEAFRIFDLEPQEGLHSENFWERVVPEDYDRVREVVIEAVHSKNDFAQEYRIKVPDGTVKHIHTIGHPVLDSAGEVLSYLGTNMDVTERKRAEAEREKLRQLEADVAHMNRVSIMGELAASLAHEIKQPMTAAVVNARACARWLRRDLPDLREACDAASKMVDDVTRAAEIIDRIRSLYKRGAPDRESVDLNEVVREMVSLLDDTATRNSVSIRTELDPGLPATTADRVQLRQVLMNLMLNGIEAMKEDGGELIVRSERDDDGQFLISVRDSGIGVPPDDSERIFETFFTTKPQGTGMGLPVSRRIIESHGGRLWVGPNTGQGATFQFTLPGEVASAVAARSAAPA